MWGNTMRLSGGSLDTSNLSGEAFALQRMCLQEGKVPPLIIPSSPRGFCYFIFLRTTGRDMPCHARKLQLPIVI